MTVCASPEHICTTSVCRPYDTMEEVIGLRGTPGHGSLREWGVTYRELPLTEQGLIDWDALRIAITPSKLPAGITGCQWLLIFAAATKQAWCSHRMQAWCMVLTQQASMVLTEDEVCVVLYCIEGGACIQSAPKLLSCLA